MFERIWFRVSVIAAVAVYCGNVSGCKSTLPTAVQPKFEPVPITEVDPDFRDEWQKIMDLRSKDIVGPELLRRVNRMLDRNPPTKLRIAAQLIKGEHFYALGEDVQAALELNEGQSLIEEVQARGEIVSSILTVELGQLRAFAQSRGGDPVQGLKLLDELESAQELEPAELWGARAVAAERADDWKLAVYSYVLWRAQLPKDSADAAFADKRIRDHLLHLSGAELLELSELVPTHLEPAAACLRGFAGVPSRAVKGMPEWVQQCGDLPGSIGILLPRTGRYAAFADPQAAAAVAAVRILSAQRRVSVLWGDSGSDGQSAVQSARWLIQSGAQVIVGPWDPKSAQQVIDGIAGIDRQVRFVLPGESIPGAIGVLPRLESRIQSLIDLAQRRQAEGYIHGLVVMVPENSYGDRSATEINRLHSKGRIKLLNLLRYPSGTTSFKPFVDSIKSGLHRKRVAWLLLDSHPRVELIIRQLQRDGATLGIGKRKSLVLSVAEGLSRQVVDENPKIYEGLIVAPLVPARKEQSEFDRAYFEQENTYPDASANLIWEALVRAWSSRFADPSTVPELIRIENGQILPLSAPSPTTASNSSRPDERSEAN